MDPPSSHGAQRSANQPKLSPSTTSSSNQDYFRPSPSNSLTATSSSHIGNTAPATALKKANGALPHNVDICITCVTDKPPQLPLREELNSLGIEVVYNAHGVGNKASEHEAKKLIEKFRHDEQYKDLKKRRLFAPSSSEVEQKIRDRKRQEDALEVPRGVSYEKYEKILSSSNDQGSVGEQDSTSVSGSVSTRGESIISGEKRKQDQQGGNEKKRLASPKGLFQMGLPMKFSFQSLKSSNDDSSHNNPFVKTSSESSKPTPSVQYRGPSKNTETMFQSVLRAFSDASAPDEDDDHPLNVSESRSGGTTSSSRYNSASRSRSEEEEATFPNHSQGPLGLRLKKNHRTSPADHHVHDIRNTPTPGEDASKDPSSHDVSRDPSTISTNFTRQDANTPNPVEVLASNDPIVKKFLPGLQTVPSGSSSTSSSSRHNISDESGSEDDPIDVTTPNKIKEPHRPLNEAFAAFTLNPNDQIYQEMGPITNVPKRQRKDPPPSFNINTAADINKGNWMNTAKLAFENVAAEVYKQATGSATNSPNASGSAPSGNIFDLPNNNNGKTTKQIQPLSPTSTLSSNTANQQQQQQIQIHGHQPFLFPNSNANIREEEKDIPVFQTAPPTQTQTPNPFPHHPHVEVHVRSDGSQVIVSSSIGQKSVTAFYEALQQPKTPVDSIQRMLRVCPGLVKVRLQQSLNQKGRLGLHTVCARGFPHHRNTLGQTDSSTNLALQLVEDIQQLKKLISVLVEANRGVCTVLDDNGDLPAHLLARTLMEWEAQWYEKVYEKVQADKDSDGRNAAAITKLYQSMSQCIETVLHPVAAFCNTNNNSHNGNAATTLCRAPGSVGLLLPLHIASIFTASVPTLRQLLEQDPTAATVPCNLGHLRTFIPDHSLPLELHDKLSTDFPKWEIGAEARKSKTIQIAGGANMMMEDYMRRSDLLFAFHPTVPRFRMETTRIERLEGKVISEANQMDQHLAEKGENGHLSVAVKRIWIWMCTFQDISDHFQATYYPSVKRIVDSVPSSAIPYLANIKTTSGNLLLQVAAPECQALLRTRLEEYDTTQASRLEQMMAKAVATASKSSKSSAMSYDDTTTSNGTAFLSLKGKGYVGVLCRTLFHVHEDSMPTSFILLPYKLTKNEQGKLGIDKNSSASTAVKFAECLLKLTDPKTILYFLDQKSGQLANHRMSGGLDGKKAAIMMKKCEGIKEQLLALYSSGKAYLYLIDELIGLPIVPTSGTSLYPIELSQPANIVKKLLPLMLTGMILMRGEKALSVLVNILLDKTVKHVSSNWVDAAREIIAYLYSQQDSRTDNSLPGLDALIDELRAFVSNNSSVKSTGEHPADAEWAIELSILKMVLDMNDNRKSFAGLKAKREEPGTVLWTKHRIEEELPSEKSPETPTSHEDPPGTRANGPESISSSNVTKKSSNQTVDDATNNSTPVKRPVSPNSSRDIEKLRLKATHSSGSPWLESNGDKTAMDDISLGEADSGMDGEELAGVRILLEAEEGPSLLDQESTSEEEYSDIEHSAQDKYKTVFEQNKGKPPPESSGNREQYSNGNSSDSGTAASNTNKIVASDDMYRAPGENEIGSDSNNNRSTNLDRNVSSDSADSLDDKDLYNDASGSFQSESEQMILPTSSKEAGRNKMGKMLSDRQTSSEFYLGVSSQSGEMVLPASISHGNDAYLEETILHSSQSGDEMLLPSKIRSLRPSPRTNLSRKSSPDYDSETSNGDPRGDNTKRHLHQARNNSRDKVDNSETDEDDDSDESDSDESVLKFDFVSQGSGSKITTSGRSADRLYDESRVEVIDHSDGKSLFSAGKRFENETMRLQEYAASQMNRPLGSPPTSLLPPSSNQSAYTDRDKQEQMQTPSITTPDTSCTLQHIISATSFGDIVPGTPINSSSSSNSKKTPSPSSQSPGFSHKQTLSSRSNSTSVDGRKLLQAKDISDRSDTEGLFLLPPSATTPTKYGSENIYKKDFTFMEMREHLGDQALKIDCLESTLASIKIREDKLLSRGEMLQDFLHDLVDQSENMILESDSQARKVQSRLNNLEERLLISEIQSQHLSFGVYALDVQLEGAAEEKYKHELNDIMETQGKQQHKEQKQNRRLEFVLGRAAKLERLRARTRGDDKNTKTSVSHEESMRGFDGYNSSPDADTPTIGAIGGSYISRAHRKQEYHRHNNRQRRLFRQRDHSLESSTSASGRSQSTPRPYHPDYFASSSGSSSHLYDPHGRYHRQQQRKKIGNRKPNFRLGIRDYDMKGLLRKASMDEVSIEYEMGLAMFGTLDASSDKTSIVAPAPLDAYERMRSDYNVGVSAVLSREEVYSESGYSSPGEYGMEMSSIEGDLDWVESMKIESQIKMSSSREFELPHRTNRIYRQ